MSHLEIRHNWGINIQSLKSSIYLFFLKLCLGLPVGKVGSRGMALAVYSLSRQAQIYVEPCSIVQSHDDLPIKRGVA